MSSTISRKSSAGVLGLSLIAGALAGSVWVLSSPSEAESSPTQVVYEDGQGDYQSNSSGLTFGSLQQSPSPAEEPDLVLVVTDEGGEGYIYGTDLDVETPASPAEASKRTATVRSVPAYTSDGKTRMGTFTIGEETFIEVTDK